ncbi:hypothetical protein F5879DRAFT_928148, partial [Lentinula edodes]
MLKWLSRFAVLVSMLICLILPDISDLGDAERKQCAAFIRSDHTFLVWAFSVDQVIPLWAEFEEKLIKYIWRTRSCRISTVTVAVPSTIALPHYSSTRLLTVARPFGVEDVDRSAAGTIPVDFGFGAA